jgi:peptidoglycan/LPS O-acetylase OafA/YrhL
MEKYNTNTLYFVRFVAAFMILVYHFFPAELQNQYHFRNLNEAVNFFFFISGFVMVLSNKSYFTNKAKPNFFSKAGYWVRRFARIYPSYFLAFFLVVLFNYTVKVIYPSIPVRSLFEVFGIQRWFYGGSVNFPAWTVSTEFFFYLLFPFTILWLSKTNIKKLAIVIFGLFIANLIITGAIGFTFINKVHSKTGVMLLGAVYRHPLFEYTVFLFGNLCGLCFIKTPAFMQVTSRINTFACLLSLAAIAAVVYFSPPSNPLLAAGILSPLYFVFVTSLCRIQGTTSRLLSSKFFIFLGDISFSIYIFQIPIFLFFSYAKGSIGVDLAFKTVTDFAVFTAVLVTFCSINYFIYEMPLKNFILKIYKGHKPKKTALVRELVNNGIS